MVHGNGSDPQSFHLERGVRLDLRIVQTRTIPVQEPDLMEIGPDPVVEDMFPQTRDRLAGRMDVDRLFKERIGFGNENGKGSDVIAVRVSDQDVTDAALFGQAQGEPEAPASTATVSFTRKQVRGCRRSGSLRLLGKRRIFIFIGRHASFRSLTPPLERGPDHACVAQDEASRNRSIECTSRFHW